MLVISTGATVQDPRRSTCQVFTAGTDSANARTALLTPFASRPGVRVNRTSTGQIDSVKSGGENGADYLKITGFSPSIPTGRVTRVDNDAGRFAFPERQDTIGLTLTAVRG